MRKKLVERLGCEDDQLRIERARFVPKEGKGKYGCPVAKHVSTEVLVGNLLKCLVGML